jgi:hypothetical protein
MTDGMEESRLPESASLSRDPAESIAEDPLREHAAEPAIHHALK